MSVLARIYIGTLGLARTLRVPAGTQSRAVDHINHIEGILGIKATRYGDGPAHWNLPPGWADGIADEDLCSAVMEHNQWVFWMHANLAEWGKNTVVTGEDLTPELAQEWWHGMAVLTVAPGRWTKEFYRHSIEHLYEVMRGRDSEGVFFDAKALTPAQAGSVIRLFGYYLDQDDQRLEVPKGCDFLMDCDEYEWCEKCGAVTPDHADACRRRDCPLREVPK